MRIEFKGPNRLGYLIKGHVFDTNKKRLEQRLQNMDSRLYIEWNPRKNAGNGIWEIRRRPAFKEPVYKCHYQGHAIYQMQYCEDDMVNHVLDVPYLTERILPKLYEMDTYRIKNWLDVWEQGQQDSQNKIDEKNREELRYNLKSNRKYLQILRDAALAGYNPAQFFAGQFNDN